MRRSTNCSSPVTRKDSKGQVWGPQERIDKVNALKMITRWAAEYVLKPDKIGSIEPGKLADLVVLDKDYLTTPDEQVHEIRPQLTMLGGKMIYVHPNFANEYNLKPNGAVIATQEDLQKRRTGRVAPNF
jgi:predicted amidohydrolase YtcJ